MHTTDALILSGFVAAGVNTIYTTDSDLEMYRKKGVKVVNLQGRPAKWDVSWTEQGHGYFQTLQVAKRYGSGYKPWPAGSKT